VGNRENLGAACGLSTGMDGARTCR